MHSLVTNIGLLSGTLSKNERKKTIADLSRSNSFIFSLYARVNFTRVEKEQLIYPLSALVSCVRIENLAREDTKLQFLLKELL